MSRAPDPEKELVVSAKVSRSLKAQLEAAAASEGRKLSEYLREHLPRLCK